MEINYDSFGFLGKTEKSGAVEVVINQDTKCIPPASQSRDFYSSPTPQVFFSFNDNKQLNNLFRVKTTVPHMFGLIPIVSTLPVTQLVKNFRGERFNSESERAQNSAELMCSTLKFLLPPKDITLENGFDPKPTEDAYLSSRYEFNETLRGWNTVQIYKSLNLDQCTWSFDGFFSLEELTRMCGAVQTRQKLVSF